MIRDPATSELVEKEGSTDQPADKQDNRSVVPLESRDLILGSMALLSRHPPLINLPDAAAFIAGPSV